jgi:serine/threonine protein kinase
MPLHRSTDSLIPELQRNANPPRPSRLVTDPMAQDSRRTAHPTQSSSSLQQNSGALTQNGTRAVGVDRNSLPPGTILRGGRYRLYELQEHQEWLSNAYETMWVAQDAQRGAAQVIICEVALPDSNPMVVQSILRSSTMALTSVGRHPHIATLSDAFSDKGRHFFVFEPVEGESLLSRMRRTGRAMQEQEVIECCLQMTEVLELLAQQTPPLVHGMIRPEHIIVGRGNSGYVLTSFSILMAGGATQFISGIDRTHLPVYAAPELTRGVIDVRSDLFSLIATAYHAVTGSIPASVSGSVPQAQRLNPNISSQLDAILSKGLRPIASQRYQRPSELRQDLLAMRSVNGSLVSGTRQRFDQSASRVPDFGQSVQRPAPTSTATTASTSRVPDSVAQAFQSLAPAEDLGEQKLLLPRPEELPPLGARNDMLHAALWLSAILVSLILLVVFSRGFF